MIKAKNEGHLNTTRVGEIEQMKNIDLFNNYMNKYFPKLKL
ncbi:hypothetical protein [Tepidibacter sp. Z1-5]